MNRVLSACQADQKVRNYAGPGVGLSRALIDSFGRQDHCLCAVARLDGQIISGAIFLIHGRSATYQFGWTDTTGRDCGAQHAVIWHGGLALRARGVECLDMGGVYAHAPGLRIFKSGVGAHSVTLPGMFIG
jgi:lipid II:glycine glycyltransferase (peptidoglycan interpeptide bridge formation enzyme)